MDFSHPIPAELEAALNAFTKAQKAKVIRDLVEARKGTLFIPSELIDKAVKDLEDEY